MPKKQKNDLSKVLKALGFSSDWCLICDRVNDFSSIVKQLIRELSEYYGLADTLPEASDAQDFQQFSVNVEKFISLYGCPYWELNGEDGARTLSNAGDRALLLLYFCSEVLAIRLANTVKPLTHQDEDETKNEIVENKEIYRSSCIAFKALGLPCPASEVDISTLFATFTNAITSSLARSPPNHMGKPILPLFGVSAHKWSQISRLVVLLEQEYSCRHFTLLKRFDVTIQSFKWSTKAKSHLDEISAAYNSIRRMIDKCEFPKVANLLAARDNQLFRIEKTSGTSARKFTACELNKVLMGKVPDRGGRAWELEPPPPEMPSFKQRENNPPTMGRGGSRGGAHQGRGRGQPNYSGFSSPGAANYHHSAGTLGSGYIIDNPGNMYAHSQQMGGLVFEPGLPMGQNISFQYQSQNNYNVNHNPNYHRGRGGRGRR